MKILVISLAGIGDTLFATPLIHELRVNFPDATIDVLVKEAGSRDLLENNLYVNRVFYRNLLKCGRLEALRFLWSLRREHYQLSINTHPQSRIHYRIAARLAGAKTRVSHEYECFTPLDRWLVNRTLSQNYTRHAVENNLAVLPLIGMSQKLPMHELEIFLTTEEQKWAREFLAANNLAANRWLGIHVGSGGTKNLALRRWPLKNYIELARRIRAAKMDLPVLFFGGPEEKKDHEKIRQELAGAIFPLTKNLRQAAALLRSAWSFLSVDTSLMHVAAAMKVPAQVVIETPTWNKPIEPYGNLFTLVKNPVVAGRNLDYYRYDGGDIKGTREELLACMESVEVEDVFETLKRLM
jgi:lipopolysaccharide heptosyltransferase III